MTIKKTNQVQKKLELLSRDIRMELAGKDEALQFIKSQEGKWVYIKFNCQNGECISGVYTKMKIWIVEENSAIYIYGEEDEDRLTIAWDDVQQVEMTPIRDEVLIRVTNVEISIKKYQCLVNVINELPVINRHMIMTEGKTDWKILKAALEHFKSNGRYLNLDVDFVITEQNIGGYDALQKIRDYNALFPNEKVRIFIFDADVQDVNQEHEDCEKGYKVCGNNVYSFTIPVPELRKETPLISIENYFSDDDIKTFDENGNRLFMSGEFNANGRLKEDNEIVTCKNKKESNHIIDDFVFRIKDQSITKENFGNYDNIKNKYRCIALSKNEFAENILYKKGKFANVDFENFALIFDLITNIFKEYEEERNSGEEISRGIYLEKREDGFEDLFIRITLPNQKAYGLKASGMIQVGVDCYVQNMKIVLDMEAETREWCHIEIPVDYSEQLIDFMKKKIENLYNRIYLIVFDEMNVQVRSCELFRNEDAVIVFQKALQQIREMNILI